MNRRFIICVMMLCIGSIVGCTREKIVTETEYVPEIEYVELPPDTITVYDTTVVTVTDTLFPSYGPPNENLAYVALQYHTDPLVFQLTGEELGLTEGWVFYMSQYQVDLTEPSSGSYDIYGQIDYWSLDWSVFYPIEFGWRVTYVGGDPADPGNWELSEPPATSSRAESGLHPADGARVTHPPIR